MTTRRLALVGLSLGTACALAAVRADALALIFEPVPEANAPVDQGYGDRAAATSQDGFVYGPEGGFTPNVVVDYGVLPFAVPSLFVAGFGDLRNVLFDRTDGFGHLEIGLTADEGWNVRLFRFEMAAWNAVAPINAVQVYTEAGTLLFDAREVEISHDTRTVFAFDPPLEAPRLVVSIDCGNLGGASDYIGVDNVVFGQVEATVPVEMVSWGELKARSLDRR